MRQVSTTKSYDSTPGFLSVSMGTPPYIAMTLGDKVVTVMDYSGVYKEEVWQRTLCSDTSVHSRNLSSPVAVFGSGFFHSARLWPYRGYGLGRA